MFRFSKAIDKSTGNYELNFTGQLPERFKEMFTNFFELYEAVDVQERTLSKSILMRPPTQRVCRFCGKGYPDTTFKKDAHLIPQLIGNKHILSDFECDICNQHFSKYETDLAAFLGISRSFSSLASKNKVPKYKSPDKSLVITKGNKTSDFERDKIVIISEGKNNIHFDIDESKKQFKVYATKETYTPLNVYKILVKIGLSTLDDSELKNYKTAFEFISTKNHDEIISKTPFPIIVVWNNPGLPFPSPLSILYKKKNPEKPLITHTLTLYFNNSMYQLFLPFSEMDNWMFDGKQSVEFNIAPPFVDDRIARLSGYPTYYRIDMSSSNKKKGEQQIITLTFDKLDRDVKS